MPKSIQEVYVKRTFSRIVDIIFVRSIACDTTIVNVIRSLSKQYSAIFLGVTDKV